ncbi:MAG: hypothetical protein CMN28_03875 [Salinisphaeraceae bacterium]|nr:hypothetical protein [Salinisphaeraceae bacterium]
MRLLFLTLLLLAASPVLAQQYRTQVQEVPASEAEQKTAADLERELQNMPGDSYARALTLRHLASEAASSGDTGKARNYLQQALDTDALSGAANEEIRATLGRLYAADGQHRKVVDVMAPLLRGGGKPDGIDGEAWLALGNAYAQLGQWDKAVRPLQYASVPGSRGEALYRLQLAVFMKSGNYDKAAGVLRKLLELDPGDPGYLLQLAAIETRAGNDARAAATLQVAERLGLLNSSDRRLQLIRAYMEAGVPYVAAERLEGWMSSGQIPAAADNYQLLAAAWSEAEEFGQALAPLKQAANLTGSAELFSQLGQLHMDLANWDKAVEAFQAALNRGGIGSRTGELYMSKALAHYQLSQDAEARGAFSKARGYSKVASLAGQWLEFLDARPEGFAPVEIAGLAGMAGASDDRGLAGGGQSGGIPDAANGESGAQQTSATGETAPVALPEGVPDAGDHLTPVGAVLAGNASGSIPPWRGGLAADRSAGPGSNPHGADSPAFTITRDNLDAHRDQLSAGHLALFRRYPDYRMPVYPTRRSAAFPDAIYRASLANQSRARLLDPDSLTGARLGVPFRRPNTGVEAMWNHRLRYRGSDFESRSRKAVVAPNGDVRLYNSVEEVLFGYGNLNRPADIDDNIIALYLAYLNVDGRPTGTALVHETMNKREGERRIWFGVPGTQRLFRIPPVGYDNPMPNTENLQFVDQIDMYNGSFDRYVWRLVGRREMIVPYNGYKLLDPSLTYSTLLQGRFPDPQAMRYERHRVWVIEATERGGADHQFGKRVFYLDEDSWSILMVDNYDEAGELWRFQEGHIAQYAGSRLSFTAPVFIFDLRDGRYLAERLTNESGQTRFSTGQYAPEDFQPASIRRRLR